MLDLMDEHNNNIFQNSDLMNLDSLENIAEQEFDSDKKLIDSFKHIAYFIPLIQISSKKHKENPSENFFGDKLRNKLKLVNTSLILTHDIKIYGIYI